MHGPTCIFRANLTRFSLKNERADAAMATLGTFSDGSPAVLRAAVGKGAARGSAGWGGQGFIFKTPLSIVLPPSVRF